MNVELVTRELEGKIIKLTQRQQKTRTAIELRKQCSGRLALQTTSQVETYERLAWAPNSTDLGRRGTWWVTRESNTACL